MKSGKGNVAAQRPRDARSKGRMRTSDRQYTRSTVLRPPNGLLLWRHTDTLRRVLQNERALASNRIASFLSFAFALQCLFVAEICRKSRKRVLDAEYCAFGVCRRGHCILLCFRCNGQHLALYGLFWEFGVLRFVSSPVDVSIVAKPAHFDLFVFA